MMEALPKLFTAVYDGPDSRRADEGARVLKDLDAHFKLKRFEVLNGAGWRKYVQGNARIQVRPKAEDVVVPEGGNVAADAYGEERAQSLYHIVSGDAPSGVLQELREQMEEIYRDHGFVSR